VSLDGRTVNVKVDGNGAAAMLELVRALDASGLDPASMLLREPTLDDVFLDLTGHTTDDGASADADVDAEAAAR